MRLMRTAGQSINSATMGNELVMTVSPFIFFRWGHMAKTVLPQSIKIISPSLTNPAASSPISCLACPLADCLFTKPVRGLSSGLMTPPCVLVSSPSSAMACRSLRMVAGEIFSFLASANTDRLPDSQTVAMILFFLSR